MSSSNLINDLTVDEIIHKNILIEEMFFKSHLMFKTVMENFENYKKINNQHQQQFKYNSLLLCLYINLPDLSFPEFEFEEKRSISVVDSYRQCLSKRKSPCLRHSRKIII
jgi:hypothetical protein